MQCIFVCLVEVPLVEVCQVCSLSETLFQERVEKHSRRNYRGRSYPKTIRPLPSSICSPFSCLRFGEAIFDLRCGYPTTMVALIRTRLFCMMEGTNKLWTFELCFSFFCVQALLNAFKCWGDGTHKGVRSSQSSSVDVPVLHPLDAHCTRILNQR